jgi:hypothetical protein
LRPDGLASMNRRMDASSVAIGCLAAVAAACSVACAAGTPAPIAPSTASAASLAPSASPAQPAPAAAPAPAARSTTVVTFTPAVPTSAPRDGECWTRSIAAPRDGAWRCRVGNEVVDPCFSVPTRPGIVVCAADPANGDPGFPLRLTKPLPADVPAPSVSPAPWLIRLADGQTCRPFTGTVPFVDGRAARWYCGDAASGRPLGLITAIDDRTAPWTATWYPASAGGGSPSTAPKAAAHPLVVAVTNAWE